MEKWSEMLLFEYLPTQLRKLRREKNATLKFPLYFLLFSAFTIKNTIIQVWQLTEFVYYYEL